MAKLTSKQRNSLPSSKFALPGRRYPVNDRSHAANAKARASQQEAAGNLSSSEKSEVDAVANKVLKNHGVKLGTRMHSPTDNGFDQHSL